MYMKHKLPPPFWQPFSRWNRFSWFCWFFCSTCCGREPLVIGGTWHSAGHMTFLFPNKSIEALNSQFYCKLYSFYISVLSVTDFARLKDRAEWICSFLSLQSR